MPRAAILALNREIAKVNARSTEGPPTRLGPLDVEATATAVLLICQSYVFASRFIGQDELKELLGAPVAERQPQGRDLQAGALVHHARPRGARRPGAAGLCAGARRR